MTVDLFLHGAATGPHILAQQFDLTVDGYQLGSQPLLFTGQFFHALFTVFVLFRAHQYGPRLSTGPLPLRFAVQKLLPARIRAEGLDLPFDLVKLLFCRRIPRLRFKVG